MTKTSKELPLFNLWTEPWISLERDGMVTQHSIRDTLLNAHEYNAIYDSSPLVVVGVHRLLTAILQDALDPQENNDLEQLWKDGKFNADKIEQFEMQYADRFDLFSEDKPFYQSVDLPMFPNSKEEQKEKTTVARLFPEVPSGTLTTHYHHVMQDNQCCGSRSAARSDQRFKAPMQLDLAGRERGKSSRPLPVAFNLRTRFLLLL
jgi:CRISPR type I-E-associated protein CasA/Cse1